MTVDHVLPQSGGEDRDGLHSIENLRLCCRECNSAKGKRHFSPEELTNFRCLRRLKRDRDEQWFQWNGHFIQELRAKPEGLEAFKPEELGESLIAQLNSLNDVSEVQPYHRSTSETCIEFRTRNPGGGKPQLWYFYVDTFLLQAYQLGEESDHIDAYDLLWYFQDELRSKYVEPFLDAVKGAATIEREVRSVEAVWHLKRSSTDRE